MFITEKIITKTLLIFLCTAVIFSIHPSSLCAQWNVYKQVQVQNSSKDCRLRFSSSDRKTILAWLILGRKEPGVFLDKLPIYKVDDNAIHKIEKGKQYKALRISDGYWIRWIISDEKKPSKALAEFINGKEVVFQYYRNDGKIKEAVFPLEGIKEAIAEIMD